MRPKGAQKLEIGILFQNRSHHSAQQAMHENETELVSAQKKTHPKGIQFSEEKLLVSLASFIQESG